jgi:hypothetical protein
MRLCVFSLVALAAPAWAAPPSSAPVPASRPAARGSATSPDEPGGPALGPARTEFRFDALRIDGTLRGPEALDVGGSVSRDRRSLARLRRSFVHRVFETVEAPGLHGGH